jgi:hypothetical protein
MKKSVADALFFILTVYLNHVLGILKHEYLFIIHNVILEKSGYDSGFHLKVDQFTVSLLYQHLHQPEELLSQLLPNE